ncbi:family 20 glycosylhydrolase [Chitinophaga japonensis]|uniref:beta-N-acetylhexosaminidase n=1 Tax=Chitinophaga japonensis TaxID=104662 RepID=A0A562T4D8_CHIJA|nr:family 20 glycosylhydrolase [Chitinophaga japonensis]TWI88411.1 hexosaminidase [Chitinophaga japonensis]
MKKFLVSSLGLLLCLLAAAQQQPAISIIPKPASVQELPGSFRIQKQTLLLYKDAASKKVADLLNTFLQSNNGITLSPHQAKTMAGSGAITVVTDSHMPEEGYSLWVTDKMIQLRGNGAGLFYGLQTLQQLIRGEGDQLTVPAVKITDAPRFAYRGLMLDCGRYFFPASYVKQFIDLMAHYKFNRFHWHLTEDQGWRIEIKRYPRLQEIASTRKETVVGHAGRSNTYDGKPHGGYYTQDEVRDIVQYAADRHITVVPEIEMPGHSEAALAAYPNLGCTGGPYEVATKWGVHKEVYCAGNDSVYTFLENVLTEVMDLFPGKYIHIGGDECPKDRWKACPKCQARMKALGLKDEHALQSYFIQRMEKFLNSKGRSIIGWDEILEGGLAPNATVMSWRGEAGGIAAAQQQHDVIMTPNTYLYLDYYQGNPASEPLNIGGFLPLQTVYNYEPLPPSLTQAEQKYIKGVQGNIWTEYMPSPQMVDYMTWPRALAVAEITWSGADKKHYADFLERLPAQLAYLDKKGVPFRIPEPAGLENDVTTESHTAVSLQPLVQDAAIYYTTDGSEPTESSQRYNGNIRLALRKEPVVLKCIVVTPSGRKSAVYSATYQRRDYQAAANASPANKGARFSAYHRAFKQAKQISGMADSSGVMPYFNIRPFLPKDKFSVAYEGYFKADADDIYEFSLKCDDGAVLYVDGELALDNDGEHAPLEKTAILPLRKGFHQVKLLYFNAGGGAELGVTVRTKTGNVNLRNALFN